MSESDQALMQSIKTQYTAAIAQCCSVSSVKPAFLAALIANESGGNPNAKRFEAGVLTSLWNVLLGRKTAYGSITHDALTAYLDTGAWTGLDNLATSWGLTQIMGYHVFDLSTTIANLQSVNGNLLSAVKLVTQFATQYSLDFDSDAADLFRCWNTGRPDGQTFDPNYAQNGLARLQLFEALG